MRTFLEVEGKMGPIPQPAISQYRPPQPDTNANVRKDNATEKRKRVVPTKRFRANTAAEPNEAAMCPPAKISKVPTNIKPPLQEGTSENRPPTLRRCPVCKSTPWPGAGKISGNLFEERNDWLLPPNYVGNNNVKDITSPKPPIKEEPKTEEQSFSSPKTEKCGWGPICSFCKNQEKEEEEDWDGNCQNQLQTQHQQKIQMPQAGCPQTVNYQRPQNFQKLNQGTSNE